VLLLAFLFHIQEILDSISVQIYPKRGYPFFLHTSLFIIHSHPTFQFWTTCELGKMLQNNMRTNHPFGTTWIYTAIYFVWHFVKYDSSWSPINWSSDDKAFPFLLLYPLFCLSFLIQSLNLLFGLQVVIYSISWFLI
jgi:hypothetical protein